MKRKETEESEEEKGKGLEIDVDVRQMDAIDDDDVSTTYGGAEERTELPRRERRCD